MSWRTIAKARADDIAFIERVRSLATVEDVERIYADHVQAPQWKRVAIQRAAKRVTLAPSPCPAVGGMAPTRE